MTSTESTVHKIMAPRGVPDYIPQQSDRFLVVRSAFLDSAYASGYGYIELPIFEHTELFARGVGESSDIVNKEMYTFLDKGDRSITLRPEGTAGVMRAIIEHGLDRASLPIKLAYSGPMFRYENPQSGRYRQFQTVGIEAVGIDDPALDVEVIAILHNALAKLGLKDYRLEINSLGDGLTRGRYREKLIEFLHDIELDESTRKRVQLNPLRILDDKRAEIKSLLVDAPEILDFLSDQAQDHFQAVCDGLTRLGINYVVNPRLVRGLDYYHKTTFEFIHNCLGAQATVGGGGRYDGLLAQLGGLPLSGVGFGVGIERVLLALDQEKIQLPVTPRVAVFGVPMGSAAKEYLMVLINDLRVRGIKSDLCYGDKGLKAAMKAADRSGARYAIVVGERELDDKTIVVKDLTNGQQSSHPMSLAITVIEKLLAEDSSTP